MRRYGICRSSARAGSPEDNAKGLEMAERITFELNGDTEHRGRAGYAITVRARNKLRLDRVIGADRLAEECTGDREV